MYHIHYKRIYVECLAKQLGYFFHLEILYYILYKWKY